MQEAASKPSKVREIAKIRRIAGSMYRDLKGRFLAFERSGEYGRISWSQQGEDLILDRVFGRKRGGFYVDVGAHHPERFSNTRMFYLRGWRGINIDPMPGSMELFRKQRPRDINLEIGIADSCGCLEYARYDEPALNSFVRKDKEIFSKELNRTFRLEGIDSVPVRQLADVLDQHLPANTIIDFLSIDAEGLDHAVLLSNDWKRFRPTCIVVELSNFEFETAQYEDSYKLLSSLQYRVYAKLGKSVIFCSKEAVAPPRATAVPQSMDRTGC